MADQFEMTKKGYDEAVARLKYLQTEKRQEVVARIQEARSHGDLSENAEYDAARNEQSAVEGEIAELEYKVKNAKIIEKNTDDTYVHIGCVVKVYDFDLEEEAEYELTGSMEAQVDEGKVSIESPVGVALVGHKVGDEVEVQAPEYSYTLKILEISVK
ncbi:MAG: transcription elongation factor GreA [Clostridia bacterium]|nr:transcription elongation factor GreA [Clostridia bacterium]